MARNDRQSSLSMPAAKSAAVPPPVPASSPLELLGETVIVKTLKPIAGQTEHAAIVTRESPSGAINVMLLPSSGDSYPIADVLPESSGTSICWRRRR